MTHDQTQILINQLADLQKDFQQYVKEDIEWKKRAEPVIRAFENTSWLLKITVGVMKFLGLLLPFGAVGIAFKKYIEN